jgi:hypothetical protein
MFNWVKTILSGRNGNLAPKTFEVFVTRTVRHVFCVQELTERVDEITAPSLEEANAIVQKMYPCITGERAYAVGKIGE